jgi:hypothetical protein
MFGKQLVAQLVQPVRSHWFQSRWKATFAQAGLSASVAVGPLGHPSYDYRAELFAAVPYVLVKSILLKVHEEALRR